MRTEHQISKAGGYFNLHVIANSGQCFRMKEWHGVDGFTYFDVAASDKFIRVRDDGTHYSFKCEDSELPFWINYFDLDTDYRQMYEAIEQSDDEFLKAAAEYGKGMRILRQDYWETIISFMISQNNNIPRIKKSIEAFCEKFGKELIYDSEILYTFPTKTDLVNITLEDLQGLGLGYRDKYIHGICKRDDYYLRPDKFYLTLNPGIGPKVVSCILLYGHHKMNEYPVDTWMKKIEQNVYGGHFDRTPYSGYEGFIQQLQFYYYRNQEVK